MLQIMKLKYTIQVHCQWKMYLRVLSKNLPLVANEKESNSPQVKQMAAVKENTIYFLPNSDVEQAQLFFYMPTTNFDKKDGRITRCLLSILLRKF